MKDNGYFQDTLGPHEWLLRQAAVVPCLIDRELRVCESRVQKDIKVLCVEPKVSLAGIDYEQVKES